ncbi:MAG: hypothetical protein HQ541_14660, partial [Mariniphaga sp.]|nr:hypothetical protein [Mariniphaga sp.]
MKKILKIFAIIIFAVIVGVLGYTYVSFNSYSPGVVEAEVDETKLQYFQDSYEECRKAFNMQADILCEKFYKVENFSKPVP